MTLHVTTNQAVGGSGGVGGNGGIATGGSGGNGGVGGFGGDADAGNGGNGGNAGNALGGGGFNTPGGVLVVAPRQGAAAARGRPRRPV